LIGGVAHIFFQTNSGKPLILGDKRYENMKSEDIKRERRTQYNLNPSPGYIEAVQTLEELDDLENVYAEVM